MSSFNPNNHISRPSFCHNVILTIFLFLCNVPGFFSLFPSAFFVCQKIIFMLLYVFWSETKSFSFCEQLKNIVFEISVLMLSRWKLTTRVKKAKTGKKCDWHGTWRNFYFAVVRSMNGKAFWSRGEKKVHLRFSYFRVVILSLFCVYVAENNISLNAFFCPIFSG